MTEAEVRVESEEPTENWRKRLTFRAWHRGTREMDLLIGSFAEKYINGFDRADLAIFEEILINNDPDVYDWITGRKNPPEELKSRVLDLLLSHSFAK
ncbi:MAG TPA: succinate dehydrogenase assembly factor 2 [Alphaproteobacteria bacterium]|nr:succinate dehydrogenase assembly factor 2 [Alphaproteobacteria bacterium]HNS43964.1 succinate dehydrogenase assembly factor 2 [Alphaproteobacteria bacterium]